MAKQLEQGIIPCKRRIYEKMGASRSQEVELIDMVGLVEKMMEIHRKKYPDDFSINRGAKDG